jgi:hypothetical protein
MHMIFKDRRKRIEQSSKLHAIFLVMNIVESVTFSYASDFQGGSHCSIFQFIRLHVFQSVSTPEAHAKALVSLHITSLFALTEPASLEP